MSNQLDYLIESIYFDMPHMVYDPGTYASKTYARVRSTKQYAGRSHVRARIVGPPSKQREDEQAWSG